MNFHIIIQHGEDDSFEIFIAVFLRIIVFISTFMQKAQAEAFGTVHLHHL